jgi:U3 small nucleolar RNA-associated protein 14
VSRVARGALAWALTAMYCSAEATGSNVESYEYEPPSGDAIRGTEQDEEIDESLAFGDSVEDRAWDNALNDMLKGKDSDGEDEQDDDGDDEDEDEEFTVLDLLDAGIARQRKLLEKKGVKIQPTRKELASSAQEEEAPAEKRRFATLGVSGVASEENEFSSSARHIGTEEDQPSLSVQALLKGLQSHGYAEEEKEEEGGGLKDSELAALRREVEELEKREGPLLSSASRPVIQRSARQAAYETTSSHVGRWTDTVRAERRAQQLNFVAEMAPASERIRHTTHSMVGTFVPEAGGVEAEIAAALAEAGVSDASGIMSAEAEAAKLLRAREETVEERKARESKLARLKAVLLYEEERRRRANKSKSKSFRRIKKRQRVKEEATARERLRREDPERAAELDEAEALKAARARATLRTTESKYVQRILKAGALGAAGKSKAMKRSDIMEALRNVDELRKRTRAEDEDSEASEGAEEDEDEDEESSEDEMPDTSLAHLRSDAAEAILAIRRARRGVLRDARLLAPDGRELTEAEWREAHVQEGEPEKGIAGMAFMRLAARKASEEAMQGAKRLAKSLSREEARLLSGEAPRSDWRDAAFDGNGDDDDEEPEVVREGAGRRSFAPQSVARDVAVERAKQERLQREAAEASAELARGAEDEDSDGDVPAAPQRKTVMVDGEKRGSKQDEKEVEALLRAGGAFSKARTGGGVRVQNGGPSMVDGDDSNPWLQEEGAGRSEMKGGRGSAAATRRLGVAVRGSSSSSSSSAGGGVLGREVLDVGRVVGALDKARHPKRQRGEGDEERSPKKVKAATQHDLVQRAFAHEDNGVSDELEQEKKDAAHLEADRALLRQSGMGRRAQKKVEQQGKTAEDVLGPQSGWGAWAGDGAPKEPRWFREKKRETKELVQRQRDLVLKKRADAHARGTFINEKRDQKLTKHQIAPSALPVQFQGRREAGVDPRAKGEWGRGITAYEASLRHPLGREWNTKMGSASLTAPAEVTRAGMIITPAVYGEVAPAVAAQVRDEAKRGEGPRSKPKRRTAK